MLHFESRYYKQVFIYDASPICKYCYTGTVWESVDSRERPASYITASTDSFVSDKTRSMLVVTIQIFQLFCNLTLCTCVPLQI